MTGNAAAFRRALLEHFDRTGRALPWRSERTPYSVMVSEFMLQQTRVETVIPYYERWLRRFPGWDALAGADEDEVLREWTGLGYYRRARNLHRAARVVHERFGGKLPEDPEALKELPGVGEYTAGAVASIAFGRAVPAVDGNVRRVLCRLFDLEAPTAGRLREVAAGLVDLARAGDFNEAMMELGATVCTPRSPGCHGCPVRQWCRARAVGTVAERPARRPRKRVPRVEYVAAVVVGRGAPEADGRADRVSPASAGAEPPSAVILLRRRPDSGLLARMWEFPSIELTGDEQPGRADIAAAAARLLQDLGLPAHPTTPLPPVRHAFTHLRATWHPVICVPHPAPPIPRATPRGPHPPHAHSPPGGVDGAIPPGGRVAGLLPPNHIRIPLARLGDYPLPVAQQKIAAQLEEWLRGPPLNPSPPGTLPPASG